MSRNREDETETELVRMELKYCEHCGGLWVREGGAGVYCGRCTSKVADLPIPKRKPGRLILPVAPKTAVGRYETDISEDGCSEIEAVGGAA